MTLVLLSALALVLMSRLGIVAPWSMTVVFYPFGGALAAGMLLPTIDEQGLSAWVLGAAGGALLGGWTVPRLGLRRSLLLFGLAQTGCIAVLASDGWAPLRSLVLAVLVGLTTHALFAAILRRRRRSQADHRLDMRLIAVIAAMGVAVMLGGRLKVQVGSSLFVLPAIINLIGVAVMALPAPRPRRRLRTLHLSNGRAIHLWEPQIPLLRHYFVLAPAGGDCLTPPEQLEFLNMAQLQAAELGNTHHGQRGCYTVLYNGGQVRRRPWDHVHILAVSSVAAKRRALLLLFVKRALRACTASGLGLANAQLDHHKAQVQGPCNR